MGPKERRQEIAELAKGVRQLERQIAAMAGHDPFRAQLSELLRGARDSLHQKEAELEALATTDATYREADDFRTEMRAKYGLDVSGRAEPPAEPPSAVTDAFALPADSWELHKKKLMAPIYPPYVAAPGGDAMKLPVEENDAHLARNGVSQGTQRSVVERHEKRLEHEQQQQAAEVQQQTLEELRRLNEGVAALVEQAPAAVDPEARARFLSYARKLRAKAQKAKASG